MLVYFKKIDILRLDSSRKVWFYHCGNKRTETILQRLWKGDVVIVPRYSVHCADKLYQQLSAVAYHKIHIAARTEFNRYSRIGVDITNLCIRSPFERHLNRFIDKIYFAVERRLIACCPVQQFAEFWYVLRFKCISARSEQIERLTVHKENGFLAFVDYKLGKAVEIFVRVLPHKCGIIPFVFDYLCYLSHKSHLIVYKFLSVNLFRLLCIKKCLIWLIML